MRGFSLGMSSSSANPFDVFALGGVGAVSWGAAAAHIPSLADVTAIAQAHVVDDRRAKKMRTTANISEIEGPKGLVEKYRTPGELEWPLRLIIIGHNPSEKAWELGHYYGNPSNKMWKLLSAAGIVPAGFTASDDDACPITCGVGFTDVGFSIPGTVSSEFKKADLHSWRKGFYERLTSHAERAAATVAAAEDEETKAADAPVPHDSSAATAHESTAVAPSRGYPKIITFAGKRQWEELFYDASRQMKAHTKGGKAGAFRFGLQPADVRPPDWPFPAESTEVFVVPSSSGAAAMTNAAREGPYMELGNHMRLNGGWKRRPHAQDDS